MQRTEKYREITDGVQSDSTKRIDNASNKAVSMKIKAGIRYMGDENSVIKKGIYQNKTLSTEIFTRCLY